MSRILLASLVAIGTGVAVDAQVRIDDPQPPFYARLSQNPSLGAFDQEIFHDDQWAAIPFYRDPACIPADFNLLQFVDLAPDPFYGLRPFGCALAVEGFELWENGPGIDTAPVHSRLRGIDVVEIWFVSWPALSLEVQDGQLTIGELSSMPSLRRGTAALFSETLHPAGPSKAHNIALEALGYTDDGARFLFQAAVTSIPGPGVVCCSSDAKQQKVIIRFW
jgi:hypothetical protein